VTKNEVVSELFKSLGAILTPFGFFPKKKSLLFWRKWGNIDQEIVIGITNYFPEYKISLAFVAREELAASVMAQLCELTTAHAAETSNLIINFGRFSEKLARFSVNSQSDIDKKISDIALEFKSAISNTLNRCCDIDDLDRIINKDEMDTTAKPYSYANSLISAWLSGNLNYDNILARYKLESPDAVPFLSKCDSILRNEFSIRNFGQKIH
jgi:hypothetical protein